MLYKKHQSVFILMFLLIAGLLSTVCGDATVEQKVAESALLSLSDFPPGWDSFPYPDVPQEQVSEECRLQDSPEKVGEAASDQFFGPDRRVVSVTVRVYLSNEASQAAHNFLVESRGRCKEELQDSIAKTFALQGFNAAVTVQDLSFPELGESSSAIRILTESQTGPLQTGVMDELNITLGRLGGTFIYAAPPSTHLDADEELEVAALFVNKLKKAGQALPN